MPPEMVVGENPPEGAILDYYLAAPATGADHARDQRRAGRGRPRVLERRAAGRHHDGQRARILADAAGGAADDGGHAPHRVGSALSGSADAQLRLQRQRCSTIASTRLSWHAIPGRTPRTTLVGPMVLPGTYTATLTVDGRSYTQPITVVPDPRVHRPARRARRAVPSAAADGGRASPRPTTAVNYLQQLRAALAARTARRAGKPAAAQIATAAQTLDAALAPLDGGPAASASRTATSAAGSTISSSPTCSRRQA